RPARAALGAVADGGVAPRHADRRPLEQRARRGAAAGLGPGLGRRQRRRRGPRLGVSGEDPKTEELRLEQSEREAAERERARESSEEETGQHERRADKAAYLREKLEQRARSERESEAEIQERVEELEREAEDMERHGEEVERRITETERDWESKKDASDAPGAQPDPD